MLKLVLIDLPGSFIQLDELMMHLTIFYSSF